MEQNSMEKQIEDYLLWMEEKDYSPRTIGEHRSLLKHFREYVKSKGLDFQHAVDMETVTAFLEQCPLIKIPHALNGFLRYLGSEGLAVFSDRKERRLPDSFESYMRFYERTRNVGDSRFKMIRKKLGDFCDFLDKSGTKIEDLEIEAVDGFLEQYNKGYAPSTCSENRSAVRGFLGYLYNQRKMLKKDLASMIVSAPVFNRDNPPKFLRPDELARLVGSMTWSTGADLRSNAMVMLSYTTGLRPREIIRITLDDISFTRRELTVLFRKGGNPVIFTLPDETVKAISAYIIGARPQPPKTQHRHLFLGVKPPYLPVSRYAVGRIVHSAMIRAEVPGTPYWLRHTYAQNLLESGASLFEIKEMLGHDDIKSTKKYLHVHVKLMREVLFDETQDYLNVS
jgi:site-specific recombinase XerD